MHKYRCHKQVLIIYTMCFTNAKEKFEHVVRPKTLHLSFDDD